MKQRVGCGIKNRQARKRYHQQKRAVAKMHGGRSSNGAGKKIKF